MKRFFLLTLVSIFLLISPVYAYSGSLIVGGDSVGVVIQLKGVYVTGTYSFHTANGEYNPVQSDIQVGDVIVLAANQAVQTMEQLFAVMKEQVHATTELPITVVRGNQRLNRTLQVIASGQTFKTGLYVKDTVSGVGTASFYNPDNHTFGVLGHDIVDSSTGRSAEVGSGNLYATNIVSLRKSSKGNPGEKVADTSHFDLIGNVYKNTVYGVYGTYQSLPPQVGEQLPIGRMKDVHVGKAYIRTVLHGDLVEQFEIEITKADKQHTKDVKGMQFRITDERLLSQTGGVIQGMSGSPILQDGKIIGAITHVLVQKPDQGYGIYIEWMLDEANKSVD